jgi:5-methylcytosine-specific restriction endonuclease McrA
MLVYQTNEAKLRDRLYTIKCDSCCSERVIGYSMYKLIYPKKAKQKCSGLCVKCTNSKPNKTSFKPNQTPWNKGHGSAEEVRKARASKEYRIWEKQVLKKYNYTCVECKSTEFVGADHIKSFTFFPELRYDLSNGRALCKFCHRKTHNWGYREVYKYR